MSEANATKVQFRPRQLEPYLRARAQGSSINEVARRDLERYYNLVEAMLSTLDLTVSEAVMLCDALKTCRFDSRDIALLWTEVAGAVPTAGSEALVAKLRQLDLAQAYAVVDAVGRYWTLTGGNHNHAIDVDLARVGLVR